MLLWRLMDSRYGRRVALFYTWLIVFCRWLLTRPVGMLSTVIGLYFLVPTLGIQPLTLGQLAILFDQQDSSTKQAVGTSLLTILGFLVALTTANAAWRSQRRVDIRISAAEEIYAFFEQVNDDLLKIELYADNVIDIQRLALLPGCDETELAHKIRFLLEGTDDMTQARKRVSRMSVLVHNLQSKHALVMAQQLRVDSCFNRAARALERVSGAMWGLIAPFETMDIAHARRFIEDLDDQTLYVVSRECEKCRVEAGAAANALRGIILGEIMRPTFATAIKLGALTRGLDEILERKPDTA